MVIRHEVERILFPIWQFLWVCTLLCLPVTSFPQLSAAAGGTLVAPLAIIPLALLCITLVPVYLLSRATVPSEVIPLFTFVLMAALSAAAAYFIDIPYFSNYTLPGNNLEGFVTLGIGLAFFLATWMMSTLRGGLKVTLIFIEIGGIILLAWSSLQIIAALSGGLPEWMQRIQAYISITDIRVGESRFRVSGTTLEPSWLAHCLNILYLPLWLGFTTARQSAFHFKIYKFTVENLLLVLGIVVLVFTYSRIGLLTFSIVLFWLVIQLSQAIASRLKNRFFTGQGRKTILVRIGVASLLILVIVGALGGTAYALSLRDSRFEAFLEYGSGDYPDSSNFLVIARRMDFGERVVLWDLGWKVFEDHPFLGVGLGNTGMFVFEKISPQAWKSPELLRVMFDDLSLPNAKNLWIRLLAETGITGFSIFITWLLVLWSAARQLQKKTGSQWRGLGLTGQFALLALLMEGFSIDTFALPYYWLALGLITAAAVISRNSMNGVEIKE